MDLRADLHPRCLFIPNLRNEFPFWRSRRDREGKNSIRRLQNYIDRSIDRFEILEYRQSFSLFRAHRRAYSHLTKVKWDSAFGWQFFVKNLPRRVIAEYVLRSPRKKLEPNSNVTFSYRARAHTHTYTYARTHARTSSSRAQKIQHVSSLVSVLSRSPTHSRRRVHETRTRARARTPICMYTCTHVHVHACDFFMPVCHSHSWCKSNVVFPGEKFPREGDIYVYIYVCLSLFRPSNFCFRQFKIFSKF